MQLLHHQWFVVVKAFVLTCDAGGQRPWRESLPNEDARVKVCKRTCFFHPYLTFYLRDYLFRFRSVSLLADCQPIGKHSPGIFIPFRLQDFATYADYY